MSEELKPVRCGCGGKAVIYVTHWWGKCYVCECEECGTTTKPCDTEAEAVEAWNRAMGERTAKVNEIATRSYCGECGERLDDYDDICGEPPIKYCPMCGARLEWK